MAATPALEYEDFEYHVNIHKPRHPKSKQLHLVLGGMISSDRFKRTVSFIRDVESLDRLTFILSSQTVEGITTYRISVSDGNETQLIPDGFAWNALPLGGSRLYKVDLLLMQEILNSAAMLRIVKTWIPADITERFNKIQTLVESLGEMSKKQQDELKGLRDEASKTMIIDERPMPLERWIITLCYYFYMAASRVKWPNGRVDIDEILRYVLYGDL